MQFFLIVFFINSPAAVFSQKINLDSLEQDVLNMEDDTIKVEKLINLTRRLQSVGSLDKSLTYLNQAKDLSIKLEYKLGIILSNNNLGTITMRKGNYAKALNYLFESLEICEKNGYKKYSAVPLCSMGIIYREQKEFKKAENCFNRGLKIFNDNGESRNIAITNMNLGSLFQLKNEHEVALEHYYKSLELFVKSKDQNAIASSYGNIGISYKSMANYKQASKYFNKAYELFNEIGSKEGIANSLTELGYINIKLGNNKEAFNMLSSSLKLSKELGYIGFIRDSYLHLSLLDSIIGDYKSGMSHYKLYILYRDSLLNEEATKKVVQIEMNYEFEKKELIVQEEHKKELGIAQAEIDHQKTITYSAIAGSILLFLLLFLSIYAYRQKQILNIALAEKNYIIGEKTKEITDSINYAERIQKAFLQSKSLISNEFPESFILFMPKDIVSGDFYWFNKTSNSTIIAAADCTGHGVPGAFTSLICSEKLNECVKKTNIPGELLSKTNRAIISALRQTENPDASRDGMDIAICSLNANNLLNYAGANRPLWIIKKGTNSIEIIQATKASLGGFTNPSQEFTNHEIQLSTGDVFYIFSDGYVDQDGGELGKKLMSKNFKELLIKISKEPMVNQEKILQDHIKKWKGNREQLDDILVIGVKV